MEQVQEPVLDEAAMRSQITAIINAASHHDNKTLLHLIDTSAFADCKAVDVQDPVTGFTPLHASIAACQFEEDQSNADRIQNAHDTIQLLQENGAIWNQLDRNNETPGCIAFRLGLDTLYQLMVDAGVRAEMLLNILDEYDELADDEDIDVAPASDHDDDPAHSTNGDSASASTNYLSSALSLSGDKILDDEQNGVMMSWESDIMRKSADALLRAPGLKILNIGFGMGIIDSHIQSHTNKPAEHHIIEAHPDVLKDMEQNGWFHKPGVTIHPGQWQHVLPKLIEEGVTFDAVYYDTFAESYKDFKLFFTEQVLTLLEHDGTWSFFNGMGADRQISYDVYQKIVELDLFEAGFEVEWMDVDLPDLSAEWDGVKRKYWNIQKYRLPVCKFMN